MSSANGQVVTASGVSRRYGEGEAAIPPARRASRLNVLESLQYE